MYILEKLKPHCETISIAGALRRGGSISEPIELICVPKREVPAELFMVDGTARMERSAAFIRAVQGLGKVTTGSLVSGKHVVLSTRKLPGQPLFTNRYINIFIVPQDEYGFILALRTGSMSFVAYLAARWRKAGYVSSRGHVLVRKDTGVPVSLPTEEALFALVGCPFVEPKDRDKAPQASPVVKKKKKQPEYVRVIKNAKKRLSKEELADIKSAVEAGKAERLLAKIKITKKDLHAAYKLRLTALKTQKEKVRYVLAKYPDTRNSDILLTMVLWKFFQPKLVERSASGDKIKIASLWKLLREDNIKRHRATVQNKDKQHLPTDIAIARRRRIEESVWEKHVTSK